MEELSYAPIEGKSRSYRSLLFAIGIVIAIFIVSYLTAYLKGLQVWGISNVIPWGQLITLDIYFIGLSAGAIVVSSLGYVFKKEEYKPIGRLAVYVGLLCMIGAMICVLTDLGRPEKFWRLFMFFYLNNMTSVFAINGIFYGGYILLMIVYLWLVIEGKHRLAVIIGTVDVCWAVLVHTFTGSIFGLIQTRDILTSPIKPFEFVVAACTSGTALLIILAFISFKASKRKIDPKLLVSLGKLLSYFIIVLLIMVFFDKLVHTYFPHRQGTVFLTTGPYWPLFWIMQIGMGIVLPLIILFHPKAGKTVKGALAASLSVVIGVFGERAAIVLPGTAQVQQLFPGELQGIWGTPGSFPVTFWETTMSLGAVAMVALLFVLGLRYLPILPAQPAEEPKPVTVPASAPAETPAEPAEAAK
ncbi:MAG: polysulfide reductase NrfD [Dehalococcoidales bacterium]|nr:polysulfide reductase NrfD [Dehalococcoidales bacterium]